MTGDALFRDLLDASSRLQAAWKVLLDAGDKETAQLVYRANGQIVEAINKLVIKYSIEQREDAS